MRGTGGGAGGRLDEALVVVLGIGVPLQSGWAYGRATPQAPRIVELELAGRAERVAAIVPADLRAGYLASLGPDFLLIIGYAVPAALVCALGAAVLAGAAGRRLGRIGVVLLGAVAGLDVVENTLLWLGLSDPAATGVWPWVAGAATAKFCLALPAALVTLGIGAVLLTRAVLPAVDRLDR